MSAKRQEQGRGSIDGEHPDRGFACQVQIPPSEGQEPGPEDFKAPAQDSALYKFIFHMVKYGQKLQNYTALPKNQR